MLDREGALREEAERVRVSGVLGRSEPITRLFDYLLEHVADERAPKEIEVAQDVFRRDGAFEPTQDPTVRVTVHRLRRKLEQYYREDGAGALEHLSIPKGEYRLVLVPAVGTASAIGMDALSDPPLGDRRRFILWPFVAAAWLLSLMAAIAVQRYIGATTHPVMSGLNLVASNEKQVIAIGAGYVFGERDETGRATRIVRDFGINSSSEMMSASEQAAARANYVDIGNRHASLAVVDALRWLFPSLLSTTPATPPVILPVTELSSDILRGNDLVYVGRFDDLGLLARPVAARSGFSYDSRKNELIDRTTGKHYSSPKFSDRSDGGRDFAYVAVFPGLYGHRIAILAGLGDAGMIKASEVAVSPRLLRLIRDRVKGADSFEALIGTENYRGESMGDRLFVARRIPKLGRDTRASGG